MGDVVGWHFGTATTSDDHVSVVIAVTTLTVVEGDAGTYPSKVRQNTSPRTVNNNTGISGYATVHL